MPLNLIIRAIRSAKWPETCGCISGEKSHWFRSRCARQHLMLLNEGENLLTHCMGSINRFDLVCWSMFHSNPLETELQNLIDSKHPRPLSVHKSILV
jgi:hypothetical protein